MVSILPTPFHVSLSPAASRAVPLVREQEVKVVLWEHSPQFPDLAVGKLSVPHYFVVQSLLRIPSKSALPFMVMPFASSTLFNLSNTFTTFAP